MRAGSFRTGTQGAHGGRSPSRERPARSLFALAHLIAPSFFAERRPAGASVIAAFVAVALAACVAFGAPPAQAAGEGTLEIVSKTGVHAFTVELATNDAERSRGLMFRKELPEGRGMLFNFSPEQPVSFWMHNTFISLDMIFIRADGHILHIAENTEPMSDRLIPSGGPVRAVLEVIAGTARKLGIAPGDRVESSIFTGVH